MLISIVNPIHLLFGKLVLQGSCTLGHTKTPLFFQTWTSVLQSVRMSKNASVKKSGSQVFALQQHF